ncbi:acyl-CoA dehydrogenase family protein [Raineya sp.]|jgi:alkylation response protein AidB-like acyl-CoA dehydrogenase
MNNTAFSYPKTTEKHPQNRVVSAEYKSSRNFYESDKILKHFLRKFLSENAWQYMLGKWQKLGKQAACDMDLLSQLADKNPPELIKRNFFGETINEIRFHPAYHTLSQIAIDAEMFRVKWQPDLRKKFSTELHKLGFSSFFLFNMSEGGLPCPLCMTDGVARLIDKFAKEEDKQRLLPHIYTTHLEELYTGAMFLTEKAGGSDVGANLVSATHWKDDYYLLNGEKWFCSNANAEIIFALARTNPEIKGTKGLSIFLVEKNKPDGSPNTMEVVRLKDKLGVRSMASAECIFTDTVGKLIGKEGEGFKIMTEMINLSRLYNAVGSLSEMRRALIEAYQFLKYRISFGISAIEHPLIRTKLTELASIYTATFYLTWHAIHTLDKADSGSNEDAELLRLLTPMLKKTAAEAGVYLIRECMELMGGIGYIEDGVMPKLLRDTLVLPIWEGAGNIMVLDMLRASVKSEGLKIMLPFIQKQLAEYDFLLAELQTIQELLLQLPQMDKETTEATAKPLFERLAMLYELALLKFYQDSESSEWIEPALQYFLQKLQKSTLSLQKPLPLSEVEKMIAWVID